ncbi:hypothetical protein LOK49_LG01G02856 [Camellia lanceoleosa]|uniref:Uncharacterized protein n=1 Tax=Camellia lanceoleosa TaxID=1840588 RepID=A0ACC0IY84_9ERIC|nr:hypothetical protein LOK49_LG01G02856 [Camellia lanceoleosa]
MMTHSCCLVLLDAQFGSEHYREKRLPGSSMCEIHNHGRRARLTQILSHMDKWVILSRNHGYPTIQGYVTPGRHVLQYGGSIVSGVTIDTIATTQAQYLVDAEVVSKEQQDSLTDSCLPDVEDGINQKDSSVPDLGNLEQTRALVSLPYKIDGSEACLRKMLPLVFSQDKSFYEAVENAFITIYIRKILVETAKNLLYLAIDSNIGDLAALEFIGGALVSKGDIVVSTICFSHRLSIISYKLYRHYGIAFALMLVEPRQSKAGVLCLFCAWQRKSSSGFLVRTYSDIIDIGFGRKQKYNRCLLEQFALLFRGCLKRTRKIVVDSSFGFLKDNGINAELGLATQDAMLDTADRAEKEIVSWFYS